MPVCQDYDGGLSDYQWRVQQVITPDAGSCMVEPNGQESHEGLGTRGYRDISAPTSQQPYKP
jgi:hypothetical protein